MSNHPYKLEIQAVPTETTKLVTTINEKRRQ